MTISTSFIIPHKGRLDFLFQTVESITKLKGYGETTEIIVVTKEEELTLPEPLNSQVQVLKVPDEVTISYQRNLGARNSKGNFLAFLDADVQLNENWLVRVSELLADDDMIVSAIQISCDDAPITEDVRVALNHINKDKYLECLAGSNLFLRRADFDLHGGFPEEMETCEDVYFTGKFAKNLLTSKSDFVHLGEDKSFSQLFKKEIWRAKSNLASVKGRKIQLLELPSLLFPLIAVFAPILTIILVLLGANVAAATILCLGFVPAIAYSLRLKLKTEAVSIFNIFAFYVVYFFARGVGSLMGIKRERV